ncbi:TRAP transporter large permease [Nitratireductor mangrovi]|uniref:TRAP transporter large permease protein n=1 Tax=Nitratireductor mangrovi TaxID=2599600 RepID=A0A5B8KYK0_9HYPH|nr:TRAP transporter large permease [Nitratireductor mangrovi]QDZ00548.1 TRAP transporter large permease [Nitratireductor mangrovi]
MALNDLVAVGGFVALFLLLLLRVPIGVAMGLVGVGGFGFLSDWKPAFNLLALSPIRTVTDYSLGLVPMFILMGVVASASGMSGELYRAANAFLGHRRGGLAMATITACGGFSAICGSSVATAATMAKVALPEMKRYGYPDTLATGSIAAGGTLGVLIPPSIVLAIYGVLTEQDIGRLFIAGLVPGLLAVLMYLVTVRIYVTFAGGGVPAHEKTSWRERFAALRDVWAILLLFIFVIGGIYGGMFTPSEAAGMGAAGAIIISVVRRRMGWRLLFRCLLESIQVTAGIFMILIGAILFGYFLTITQTPQKVTNLLLGLELGAYPTLILILLFMLLLGCVLDAMAMIILMIPILYPVVLALGFDPIWFGVIIVMTVELGLITPPIGMNVFVINTLARDVSLQRIYRGVLPFVATDVVRLALLVAFPWIVLWLPNTMR